MTTRVTSSAALRPTTPYEDSCHTSRSSRGRAIDSRYGKYRQFLQTGKTTADWMWIAHLEVEKTQAEATTNGPRCPTRTPPIEHTRAAHTRKPLCLVAGLTGPLVFLYVFLKAVEAVPDAVHSQTAETSVGSGFETLSTHRGNRGWGDSVVVVRG